LKSIWLILVGHEIVADRYWRHLERRPNNSRSGRQRAAKANHGARREVLRSESEGWRQCGNLKIPVGDQRYRHTSASAIAPNRRHAACKWAKALPGGEELSAICLGSHWEITEPPPPKIHPVLADPSCRVSTRSQSPDRRMIAPWPAGYNAPVDSVPMKAYVCPRAAVGYSRCRENSDPIRSAPEFPKCWCGCSLLRVRLATAAVRFPSKTMPPAHRRQAHPKGLGPRRRRARLREGGSGAHRQRAHANRMAWACWAGCDTG